MKKFLAILLLMVLIVSACATNAPAAKPETQPPAKAVKTDFVPTDPASVNLAAGKPQLIEFFAFW